MSDQQSQFSSQARNNCHFQSHREIYRNGSKQGDVIKPPAARPHLDVRVKINMTILRAIKQTPNHQSLC